MINLPTEAAIQQFMGNFRASFPDSSISPKMHHIIPWAKQWHVGFGLLGEQKTESILARFNTRYATKDLPLYKSAVALND